VHLMELNTSTAQYVTGYVCKKMADERGGKRLDGLPPEFVRMSLRPGIGAGAIDDLANRLVERAGCQGLAAMRDVPAVAKCAGRSYALGRYLRVRLREGVGWQAAETKAAKQLRHLEAELVDGPARERQRDSDYERARWMASESRVRAKL